MHACRPAPRSFALLLVCVCALAAVGAAQTEKVQLRLVPQPDQWVQYKMTMDMAMGPAAGATGSPIPDMSTRMSMGFTQTTGHPDEDGRVKAEVTWDEFSTTATVAGKETPVPMPTSFLDQQMTAIYDAQGKLVDLQAPPEMQASVAQMRQMMTSVFSGLPTSAIAVGETVSMPVNMPMPSQVRAGASAPVLEGTNTMTLRSISQEGGERIAHFDQTSKFSMETTNKLPIHDAAAAAPTMTLIFQMSGTGTMDYNVDLGIVVRNNMQSTIDSATKFDGRMPKGMPGMDMHGTVKLTMTATY